MMTKDELTRYCLALPDVYEDHPFDRPGDTAPGWTLLRHRKNKKTFAFIYERGGLCVNLKCEPMRSDFLRRAACGVEPAYHMNKTHWNTVALSLCKDKGLLFDLIAESYRLTE